LRALKNINSKLENENGEQPKKEINKKTRYKRHKTYLINEKKKTKPKKNLDDSDSEEQFVDLLSQKSMSDNHSDVGSISNFDFQNNETNSAENLIWDQIRNLDEYNQHLKLDEDTFPMPKIKPQDNYLEWDPYDIFSLFFTDEIINHVVDSTNVYLRKLRTSFRFLTMKIDRVKDYADLTPNDFRVFLGMKIFFNFSNNTKCRGIIYFNIETFGVKDVMSCIIFMEYVSLWDGKDFI